MRIAGLQRTSTLDFPGCLCAVAFTARCNYRCFYCHNRDILEDPPLLREEELTSFLEKRAGLLDGIVFSGGEPTLQKDLAWWLRFAKDLGYKVKLDTNGSSPGALQSFLEAGLVDYVAMDFKAPYRLYPAICHAGAEGVKASMALLAGAGVEHELRTTLIPLLGMEELLEMAQALPESAVPWALQLYRQQPGDGEYLMGRVPYTPGEIRSLAEALLPRAPGVFARG